MNATLTSKGQLTIPSPIRNRLGLKTGDVIVFDETVSFLRAYKAFDRSAMRTVIGGGRGRKKTSAQWLDALRGVVE